MSGAVSQGPFRHLQSGSRLLAELGVSRYNEYGRGFWTLSWKSVCLGFFALLAVLLVQLLIFSVLALSSAHMKLSFYF